MASDGPVAAGAATFAIGAATAGHSCCMREASDKCKRRPVAAASVWPPATRTSGEGGPTTTTAGEVRQPESMCPGKAKGAMRGRVFFCTRW